MDDLCRAVLSVVGSILEAFHTVDVIIYMYYLTVKNFGDLTSASRSIVILFGLLCSTKLWNICTGLSVSQLHSQPLYLAVFR